MKKLLITGASGFIGKHIFDLCKSRGYEVYGLTTQSDNKYIKCDITNEDLVYEVFDKIKPDVVIHSAGLASVTSSEKIDYYKINILGTENVIKALTECGGSRRFIFLSTAGVYGNQDIDVLHEGLLPKPVHHYGFSKMVAEQLVLLYSKNLNITILRLFNLIGNGQNESFIFPKLIHHFKEKSAEIELGNIEPERDYISVENAVDIIESLIGNELSYNEVINLCSGTGTSVKNLVEALIILTKHNINIKSSPQFVRKNEVWRLVGDTKKLSRIIQKDVPIFNIIDSIQLML